MAASALQLAMFSQFERPMFSGRRELADAMGVSVSELQFLAFSARATDDAGHYTHFEIPKKSGGVRQISAPIPRLKELQQWIANEILVPIATHQSAHGFLHGRSIATNASCHVAAEVVINMDLEDFFPTIHYYRVHGLFVSLGYDEDIASIFAMLCTEPPVGEGGDRRASRCLPQGAPTSPPITNLICRRLDERLDGLSDALGMAYSRYADDMTFSCSGKATERVSVLLRAVRDIVEDEGFFLKQEKTRILRANQRQDVTGVVVNEKLNVERGVLKRFRALLFQIERDGPEGKYWSDDEDEDVLASIQGFASFVYMIDQEKGAQLLERVSDILRMYGR